MKRKTIYALAGTVALLALVAALTTLKAAKGHETSSPDDVGVGTSAFPVTTEIAVIREMRSYIELNGPIDADNTVEAFPEIGGRYARQRVEIGDRVSKGQIIAEIDPSKPGVPYGMNPIRAPISGTVTSLPLKVGATVTTETVIAKIGDIDRLQIRLQIPEREIANLRVGLPATVSVEAYPGEEFKASVYRVSPLVDPITHTKEAFLSFDRGDARLNAGMFARVRLYTKRFRDRVVVPADAVMAAGETESVFVIGTDGVAKSRRVSREATIDGWALLGEGVTTGEKVAVEGTSLLTDGAKVREIAADANARAKGTRHE